MITEYTDSESHPTVAAWLVDERPHVMPVCSLQGGAWRVPGLGWCHTWRTRNGLACVAPRLREARRARISYGNGRRYRGHTSVNEVRIMSRCNILALIW